MPCCSSSDDRQPFPDKGPLAKRLTLDELQRRLSDRRGLLYSYLIRSIERDADGFIQRGCAPNFQGELITLCTCKHRMRTFFDAAGWTEDKWIAGFSGVKVDPTRSALVYVMRVGLAFPSHYDLWKSKKISQRTKNAKAAHRHKHGDLFKPKQDEINEVNRFKPHMYEVPEPGHHCHRKDENDEEWQKDIVYPKKTRNHPALLVGDSKNTFVWDKPAIWLDPRRGLHPRQKKWTSLEQFVHTLRSGS